MSGGSRHASSASTDRSTRRAIIAGAVGNVVEWYEFGIYGYFAAILAEQFFASGGSAIEGLLKAYAAFAIAFFFRPVGALIFGRLGDRIGRRPTLIIVVVLMSAATAMIGLLPTYASVGAAAPVLLTLVRILQGLSAGGEFGGAVAIMTEFAPPGRRGLYGAWQSVTVALGLLGGAATAAFLAALLDPQELAAWGWRIGFLLAIPLGGVALWLRLRLEETPSFRRLDETEQPVVRPGAGETARAIALGIGRLMGWSAAGYTYLVVMPSYLQTALGASFHDALVATVVANIGFTATILPAGIASDRLGRRAVMVTGSVLLIVLAWPLLQVLRSADTSIELKCLVLFVAGASVGLLAGPGPAMLAEMFPTTVRYTGLGLAYSLSNAVFSGCAGLFITTVVSATGNLDIPAYYVMATCAVSVVALAGLTRRDRQGSLDA